MATRSIEYVISARDGFTPTANRVRDALNRMGRSAGQLGRGVGQLSGGLTRFGLIAGTAVVGGLVAAAKAAGDFEAGLNTINTIAHASDRELATIGEGIRSLAREGRGNLTDLSAAFYDLLSAGISAADAQGVLDAATKLAIGGLSTNAEAVDVLTSAINAYGQSASAAGSDADLFAKAIELGKVRADEIAASFSNVAPVAAQAGIDLAEITAAYAALTAQGTPAAEVTTQMQRAIVELLKPSATLAKLQERLGVDFSKMARQKGLVVALQAMRDAAKKAGIPFIDLFGRVEAYKFALQTTGPQQAGYTHALEAMGKSAGTAAAQMSEREKGLNFEVGRLRANIVDAAISVGEGFTPALGRLAEKLTTFVTRHRNDFVSFGEDLGKALDKIDFDRLLHTIDGVVNSFRRDVLPILRTAFDAFAALPGPVQSLAGALAALSVTPGVKDILGGLGNIGAGLAGLAAAPVRGLAARIPGVGGVFAQPVYVTNWAMMAGGFGGGPGGVTPGARGSGALSKAVKILGGVVLVGTAVELLGTLVEQGNENATLRTNLAGKTADFAKGANLDDLKRSLAGIEGYTKSLNSQLTPEAIAFQLNIDGVRDAVEATKVSLRAQIAQLEAGIDRGIAQLSGDTRSETAAIRAAAASEGARLAGVRDAVENQRLRATVTVRPQPITLRLDGRRLASAVARYTSNIPI